MSKKSGHWRTLEWYAGALEKPHENPVSLLNLLNPVKQPAAQPPARNDDTLEAEAGCWPHGPALTPPELDTFTHRVAWFARRGLSAEDSEAVADRLMGRDRDLDDRRLCLECVHLERNPEGVWRCDNWRQARIAARARDAQLSSVLVLQLQRCDGFTAVPQDDAETGD